MQQRSKTGGRRTNKLGLTVAASLAAGAAALTIGARTASATTWFGPPTPPAHGYGNGLQPRAWDSCENIPVVHNNVPLIASDGIFGPYIYVTSGC